MKNNPQKILLSPFFLLGLFLLLLNDFVLKAEFHNFFTGKISDLAGLFIFPFFISAFFPRKRVLIYVLTSFLFIFWKSSLSQSLIDLLNSFQFFKIGRTIDYTDFFALSVLPISYFYFKTETRKREIFSTNFVKRIFVSFVILLSVFAFTATTLIEDRSTSIVKDYTVNADKNEIENVLNQNEKITNIKFEREADLYPANTKGINTNIFYVAFSLKQQICDSDYPEFHFAIKPEKKFTTVRFLFANFKCKEKSLNPYTSNTLEQYEQELIAIFEREVIEKLRQNESR